MKKVFCFSLLSCLAIAASAQFPPQAGIAGSDAISVQDERIVAWASAASIERGWKDIADTSLGKVTIGTESDVLGPPNFSLLSLGDGGSATLAFEHSVRNGLGPDFVVFENGFTHLTDLSMAFVELAFVEVSSDGEHFFRFPAQTLVPNDIQLTNDDFVDATQIHNLAGKYINGYGTPFDLEELKDVPGLNVQAITHIRVIDVVGSIAEEFARYDSEDNVINDPYPTPYATGGFDLHGIGVLNSNQPNATTELITTIDLNIFPNPAHDYLIFESSAQEAINFRIIGTLGRIEKHGVLEQATTRLPIADLAPGIYWIQMNTNQQTAQYKMVKQ